jgi:NAD(P)H-hydrate repair Nnr-like enzyme with NAD(P)H-hydrate epimerase domain
LWVVGSGDDAVDGLVVAEFLFGEVGLDKHEALKGEG